MERYDIRQGEWRAEKAEVGDFVLYADAQATVEALQRERDGLEAKCLEEHVTIEQADAKVMKLEGDKGMWANERRDLLTQLENAESQLSALQALVRALPVVTGKLEVDSGVCYYVRALDGKENPVVCGLMTEQATAFALKALLAYRASLDAMTPAGGQG